MFSKFRLVVALLTLILCGQLYAEKQIVPAGAILKCTTEGGRISSKTTDVGDPVLCRVDRFEVFGHSVLPYGSYLAGAFNDYRDPGHFVGKGWMELTFDRLVTPHGIYPVSAKVVDVPQYVVDPQGRIHGKGHAGRDIASWLIPILWPLDMIELPRRGPRPTLKSETVVTVKIMDDIELPESLQEDPAPDPETLQRRPQYYQDPQPVYVAPQPVYMAPQPVYVAPQPVYVAPPPVNYGYGLSAPPPPPPQPYVVPGRPMYYPQAYAEAPRRGYGGTSVVALYRRR